MQVLLIGLRYGLTNALLVAFIAALAHGGWPIWVVVGVAILIGGGIDEAVGDDRARLRRPWPDVFRCQSLRNAAVALIVTFLLFGLIAAGGGAGLPLRRHPAGRRHWIRPPSSSR